MYKCFRCPRKCGAVRDENVNIGGFCKMPLLPKIAKAYLHLWEEPCISGSRGSGTVFFSGCNLNCVFCQNYEISHNGFGKMVSYERLAEIFKELENKGAHNINLVNPTHYIDAIGRALEIYKPSIPIVYNSSGYENRDIASKDFLDIYLFDLKYHSSEKSRLYSSAEDYFSVATKAIKAAYDRVGAPFFDENGIMQSGVIIRHLLLPMATKDAIKIIDWVAENCKEAVFSLMAQYLPCGEAARYKEISRRVTKREYDKVCEHLFSKNLKNVYIQERESSASEYIPDFNLEGV